MRGKSLQNGKKTGTMKVMVENKVWAGGAIKSMATDTNTYDAVEIHMCLESIVCDTKITYIMYFFLF